MLVDCLVYLFMPPFITVLKESFLAVSMSDLDLNLGSWGLLG